MRTGRLTRLWILCFLLLPALSACKKSPKALAAGAQMNVEQVLYAYSDADELSDFVGLPPLRCIQNSAETRLCEWQAGTRDAGWKPMAQAISTSDRVNLICELYLSGAPREPNSCTVHPRRSNRASWDRAARRTGRGAQTASERAKVEAGNRRTTDQWMTQADTMLLMSRLMGALPNECTAHSESEQVCTWRTTSQTFGHGTLAVWIDVSKSKKIRLHCILPADGSPRTPGSCQAEVGA